MFICQYCSREGKNKNSNAQHEIRCKANPDGPKVNYTNGMLGKKGGNQYTKAKETGVPYVISDDTRKKLSEASKQQVWSDEKRKRHSEIMKRAVIENPDSYTKNNVCGRVKMINYNGVNLKGSWEVRTAEWLDSQNIKWDNEVNPQPYFWNDDWHFYFPDFYLPEYDYYIEVKGFKTERDDAKWSQFKGVLIIIDKIVIDKISEYDIMSLRNKQKSL